MPKAFSYEHGGFYAKADTIADLARKIDVDAAGLEETVRNMNEYARTGVDPECHRGESTYDRYYGDPRVTPNPCLGPVAKAPFYAVRLDPGDFGTQGGMVINAGAQVMREDGSLIEGLYACGNCAAPTLPPSTARHRTARVPSPSGRPAPPGWTTTRTAAVASGV